MLVRPNKCVAITCPDFTAAKKKARKGQYSYAKILGRKRKQKGEKKRANTKQK
jgi:hypothetical protein